MELIQHQTSCNRHIPSSMSFIYQDRIASELMANSGIWPKCISINGCEQIDKWKHMTWWNCRNSNSVNDLYGDKQLVANGSIYLEGHQSNLKGACLVEAQVHWGLVTLHFRLDVMYSDCCSKQSIHHSSRNFTLNSMLHAGYYLHKSPHALCFKRVLG